MTSMIYRKEYPTLKKLLSVLITKGQFKGHRTTFWKLLRIREVLGTELMIRGTAQNHSMAS